MAWKVSGQSLELCSCKLLCSCWLGPDYEADQGWCSGAFAFDIREGNSDGVDLSGCKAAFTGQFPGNYFLGNGTLRVYVDEGSSADQRRELGAIFSGDKGGHLAGLWDAVVTNKLPVRTEKIQFQWGDSPSVTVGNIGQARLQPVKDPTGKPTMVAGAVAQAGFQIDSMDLASAKGSRWSDPDLRAWEGDSGTLHKFNWSA
jgi:hypothetical protein